MLPLSSDGWLGFKYWRSVNPNYSNLIIRDNWELGGLQNRIMWLAYTVLNWNKVSHPSEYLTINSWNTIAYLLLIHVLMDLAIEFTVFSCKLFAQKQILWKRSVDLRLWCWLLAVAAYQKIGRILAFPVEFCNSLVSCKTFSHLSL